MNKYKFITYFNGELLREETLNEEDFQHYSKLKKCWNENLDNLKPNPWHTDIEIYDEKDNLLKACTEEEFYNEY